MKLKFSFKKYKPSKFNSKLPELALIELKLLKDIIDNKVKISDKKVKVRLLKRCKIIKSKLMKFPEDLNKIMSFKEIISPPWEYEELTKPGSYYKGKFSSVRLTNSDRLIFDERSKDKLIVTEELLHYIEDWDEKYIENLSGVELELYNLLIDCSESITKSNVKYLLTKSKRNPDKIWIFD